MFEEGKHYKTRKTGDAYFLVTEVLSEGEDGVGIEVVWYNLQGVPLDTNNRDIFVSKNRLKDYYEVHA